MLGRPGWAIYSFNIGYHWHFGPFGASWATVEIWRKASSANNKGTLQRASGVKGPLAEQESSELLGWDFQKATRNLWDAVFEVLTRVLNAVWQVGYQQSRYNDGLDWWRGGPRQLGIWSWSVQAIFASQRLENNFSSDWQSELRNYGAGFGKVRQGKARFSSFTIGRWQSFLWLERSRRIHRLIVWILFLI